MLTFLTELSPLIYTYQKRLTEFKFPQSKATIKIDKLTLFYHLDITFKHILRHDFASILYLSILSILALSHILHTQIFTIKTNNPLPTFDVTMNVKSVNIG